VALAGRAPQGCTQSWLPVKETLPHREKVRIAHAAARLIAENDPIVLDSGTTTAEMGKRVTGLMQLAGLPHVRAITIGGVLRQMSYSTVRPQAAQVLSGLNADHLFLDVDGLDPEIGLTTPDGHEAQLKAPMIRVSREVTVVADSSKFGRRTMSTVTSFLSRGLS
jgi:DeoR family transcriptional regulator of aga operon